MTTCLSNGWPGLISSTGSWLGAPEGVIALCPNCHRRAHFADDGARYNDELIARLATRLPSP